MLSSTIKDDGYRHYLSIYLDRSCPGVRLEAKAYDGNTRRCPIWTAFGIFLPFQTLQIHGLLLTNPEFFSNENLR